MKVTANALLFFLAALAFTDGLADQDLWAAKVESLPIVDGSASDSVWAEAKPIITRDPIAEIDINLKAVYTDSSIAFLMQFPDASENREHKTMSWDSERGLYKTGPKREDTVVFKWSMEPHPVDLTLSAETPYKADIWYWKAHRTDHAGYADDKTQLYVSDPLPDTTRLVSAGGHLFYLTRQGDKGDAAYKALVHPEYIGETAPRFELQTPGGSRADIRAKGQWENGSWTIELSRRLQTGHPDDVAFDLSRNYLFGVSRYEIAGRRPNPRLEQPNFGRGEIGESLLLRFD